LKSEDYRSVFDLLIKHVPDTLFKYRHLTQRTIDCIAENYIWLADINTLNDPFECSLHFDRDKYLKVIWSTEEFRDSFKESFGVELTNNHLEKLSSSSKPLDLFKRICNELNISAAWDPERYFEEVNKKWTEFIEEVNNDIKICSFCETNDSLLLWSHYGDDHKGICIEYDLLEEDYKNLNDMYPIHYSANIYNLELFEELTRLQKIGSATTKGNDWEYEKEWRIIQIKADDSFSNKMKVPDPKAVYLGTRFSQNENHLKDKLMSLLQDKNIPIFQMVKHLTEYKLTALS
jgi:Protein of unknown function (DUF2971)